MIRRLAQPAILRDAAITAVMAVALLGVCTQVCRATPVIVTPILRIENGAHIANINGLASDPSRRYLASCSDDKTLRLWNASTAELLRILRPPIGDGIDGQLYAVAISPGASTVACGGYTEMAGSSKSHPSFAVYVYDRQSGELTATITGLPNAVCALSFSSSGDRLAVALASEGVRLYETQRYRQVASDSGFGGSVYALDYSSGGEIVAAGQDDTVTVYDPTLKRLASVKLAHAPYTARFSPDGSHIALGYSDSGRVDVLSASTLAPDAALNLAEPSHFSVVGWSSDSALYAGQSDVSIRSAVVRRWPDFHSDTHIDTAPVDGAITQLAPLANGDMAFAAIGPKIGIVSSKMKLSIVHDSATNASRLAAPDFLVSPDAQTIAVRGPQATERLSILDRTGQITPNPQAAPLTAGCLPPVTATAANAVGTGARGSFTLNGHSISLPRDKVDRSEEMVNCAAFTPSGDHFVLGSDWYLQYCEPKGSDSVHFDKVVAVPAAVYQVNIAQGNNVAVAALADGTVRWYRLPDLVELCALFTDPHSGHWVLWTPTGYYDCSPGGEDLIGWHVARAKHPLVADFFGASRFRDRFYRPDVLARVLVTRDEDTAVQEANVALSANPAAQPAAAQAADIVMDRKPPVVTITSPESGATVAGQDVDFSFSVHTQNGKRPKSVKVLVNGRPVDVSFTSMRKVVLGPSEDASQIATVKVPSSNCKVSVIATDDNGVSEPATVSLTFDGSKPSAPVPAPEPTVSPIIPSSQAAGGESHPLVPHGKLFVLAVGVAKYKDPNLELNYPAKDAMDFAHIASLQKGLRYTDVIVKTLTDDQATVDNVEDGLDWVKDNAGPDDVAMVLLSGHGFNDPDGDYRYAPWDLDVSAYKHTSVKFSDIRDSLSKVKGQTVLFLDTCYSGNLMESGSARGRLDVTRLINEFTAGECGIAVFAAAQGNQTAEENDDIKNGVFTKAIVEGLGGKADPYGIGEIQVLALGNFISYRVTRLTHGRQNPTLTLPTTVTDFDVAYVNE